MKVTFKNMLLVFVGILAVSCSKEDNNFEDSIFDVTPPKRTALDKWIMDNYTTPYNIEATYLWDENLGKPDKFLYPPKLTSVQPSLQVVKKIWLDSYNEVGGENFVKKIAPRQVHLIGSYNVNHNGTIVLGDAGGGARITLYNTDYVDFRDLADITEFVHTIQHEYVHILNQNKPYDQVAWNAIGMETGGYTTSWYNIDDAVSNTEGFVTSYARTNYDEDFAETASFVLLRSKVELEEFLDNLPSRARNIIERKIAIVVRYYKEQFNMDFWELRDAAERNTRLVIAGKLE